VGATHRTAPTIRVAQWAASHRGQFFFLFSFFFSVFFCLYFGFLNLKLLKEFLEKKYFAKI
jgi:hypothetical protein